MELAIGSDHAGFDLKEDLRSFLLSEGYCVRDFGTYSQEPTDYVDVAVVVAQAVASGEFGAGILVCGTGIGMSIAANKVRGIRAALCGDTFSARVAKEHNDANILTLGERVMGKGLARDVLMAWLNATFAGGRHASRLKRIADYEQGSQ